MQTEGFECARPVSDIGGRDVNRMWEALRIHGDMALDTRHQLATIVALLFGGVRILDALGVNDEKAGFLGPTIALSHRANHIFLRPAQGG